jgi:hypothetical protein
MHPGAAVAQDGARVNDEAERRRIAIVGHNRLLRREFGSSVLSAYVEQNRNLNRVAPNLRPINPRPHVVH